MRPSGIEARNISSRSGSTKVESRAFLVSTRPEMTTFTRMRKRPHSLAIVAEMLSRAALAADGGGCRLEALEVASGDGDIGAELGEGLGDGRAHVLAGARDNGDLAVEVEAVSHAKRPLVRKHPEDGGNCIAGHLAGRV